MQTFCHYHSFDYRIEISQQQCGVQNGNVILSISALGILGGNILRTVEEFLAQTCVQQVHKHTDNRSGHRPAQNIAGIMDT